MTASRLASTGVLERATAAAGAAAAAARVTVRLLEDQNDIDEVVRLVAHVWDVNGSEPVMTSALARAFAHSGNYVAAALSDGQMMGASVGFLGQDDRGIHLHSHITGVAPSVQAKGVGYALKQHQRAWALDKGLHSIRWTFDPLVSRNGYFNITKLGAEIIGYHPNFYGAMQDGINRDDESDRCVVSWNVISTRAIDAAEGRNLEPNIEQDESHTLLGPSPDGFPAFEPRDADTLLAFIPRDIVAIRAKEPEVALAWRRALRDAFEWAFQNGYSVTGMTKFGCYVLNPSE